MIKFNLPSTCKWSIREKKNILKVKMQRNHKNTYSLSANEPTTVPNTMEEPNPTTKS